MGENKIPIKGAIKVLGTWLTRDMISDVVVDDNIQKARRASFALGSTDLFRGRLNPLASRNLCETYVFPVLLYSCENWILNHQLIEKLESLQKPLKRHHHLSSREASFNYL